MFLEMLYTKQTKVFDIFKNIKIVIYRDEMNAVQIISNVSHQQIDINDTRTEKHVLFCWKTYDCCETESLLKKHKWSKRVTFIKNPNISSISRCKVSYRILCTRLELNGFSSSAFRSFILVFCDH